MLGIAGSVSITVLPESAVFCCIVICAPLHVFIVLLCFMLWALLLTSEVVFFFSLNSWFSVRGA